MVIDKKLLDELSEKARKSERLRMYLEPRRGTNTDWTDETDFSLEH